MPVCGHERRAEITHVFTYVDVCVCYLKQICKLLSSRIGTYWKESLSVFTNVCLAEASCTIQCFFVLFIFDASQADFAL